MSSNSSKISQGLLKLRVGVFFRSRFFVFLLCVLIAFVFWLLNALTYNYTTTISYPVKYQGRLKGRIIVNQLPERIKIKVNSSGFDLLSQSLSFYKDSLKVDLSKLSPLFNKQSEAAISTAKIIERGALHINNSYDVNGIYPDSIYFKTALVKHKSVQVKLLSRLSFKDQYKQYDTIKISPFNVNISGPKNIIDTIHFIYTDSLIVDNVDKSINQAIGLHNPVKDKIVIDPQSVRVRVKVDQFTEGKISLPIEVKELPSGFYMKTFPGDIQVTYLVPMNKYESVKKSNFQAYVVYKKNSKKHMQTLNVQVKTDLKYIDISNINPENVEYIIRRK